WAGPRPDMNIGSKSGALQFVHAQSAALVMPPTPTSGTDSLLSMIQIDEPLLAAKIETVHPTLAPIAAAEAVTTNEGLVYSAVRVAGWSAFDLYLLNDTTYATERQSRVLTGVPLRRFGADQPAIVSVWTKFAYNQF